MKFEYYVLNYDINRKKIYYYNVFSNPQVAMYTEDAVSRFVKNRKNYKYLDVCTGTNYYGFEGLCKEIDSILAWQECGRREYEIGVGDAFETDPRHLTKIDCYSQCKPNLSAIVRELINQYKERN